MRNRGVLLRKKTCLSGAPTFSCSGHVWAQCQVLAMEAWGTRANSGSGPLNIERFIFGTSLCLAFVSTPRPLLAFAGIPQRPTRSP